MAKMAIDSVFVPSICEYKNYKDYPVEIAVCGKWDCRSFVEQACEILDISRDELQEFSHWPEYLRTHPNVISYAKALEREAEERNKDIGPDDDDVLPALRVMTVPPNSVCRLFDFDDVGFESVYVSDGWGPYDFYRVYDDRTFQDELLYAFKKQGPGLARFSEEIINFSDPSQKTFQLFNTRGENLASCSATPDGSVFVSHYTYNGLEVNRTTFDQIIAKSSPEVVEPLPPVSGCRIEIASDDGSVYKIEKEDFVEALKEIRSVSGYIGHMLDDGRVTVYAGDGRVADVSIDDNNMLKLQYRYGITSYMTPNAEMAAKIKREREIQKEDYKLFGARIPPVQNCFISSSASCGSKNKEDVLYPCKGLKSLRDCMLEVRGGQHLQELLAGKRINIISCDMGNEAEFFITSEGKLQFECFDGDVYVADFAPEVSKRFSKELSDYVDRYENGLSFADTKALDAPTRDEER